MKELIAGIVLILVLGFGAFLYRNVMQRPAALPATIAGQGGTTTSQACTAEAKLCPNGAAVGRTGPDCSFAACPAPNVELVAGSTTLDFVLPAGYAANPNALGQDATLIAAYEKPATNGSHAVVVRRYAIPAGKTASQVMLANTMMESSGLPAKASDFKTVTLGGRSFQMITVERFEGQVHSLYYVASGNDLLRFEVLEKDVSSWTDAKLDVRALPQHMALESMLAKLQLSR